MQKELDEAKMIEAAEVQKAVKKGDMRYRQQYAKLQELKADNDVLKKHNQEYKDYFEKQ